MSIFTLIMAIICFIAVCSDYAKDVIRINKEWDEYEADQNRRSDSKAA